MASNLVKNIVFLLWLFFCFTKLHILLNSARKIKEIHNKCITYGKSNNATSTNKKNKPEELLELTLEVSHISI